jgi:uncharacterized membrane protein
LIVTQLNLFLGCVVGLAVLWGMKAGVMPGLNFHLLGAMAATLCMGPQLAVAALGLTLCVSMLNGAIEWQAWPINFLLMVVVPVFVAHRLQMFVERRFPRHLFVFLIGTGFLGAGVAVVLQGVVASSALLWSGAYEFAFLASDYLPYLLLLGFAEAWISGAIITLMVIYRPEWVQAFDERLYLLNK